MSDPAQILLVGEGHGASAALEGLRTTFSAIDVATQDTALASRCVGGIRHVGDPRDSDAPLALLAGSRRILTEEDLATRDTFNIHYSLLPRYRGLHSVVWAMLNGDDRVGLSVHKVDAQIDHGDIVHQHSIAIGSGTTSWDIMQQLDTHVAENIGAIMQQVAAGTARMTPQDHERATWVPRRNLDDCLIDFSEGTAFLERFFRALVAPYPLPAIQCRGMRYEVTRHCLVHRPYRVTNGRVVNLAPDEATITIADGLLVVGELRDESGLTCDPRAVLRLGDRLGARLGERMA